jgi:hypothetical protein
MQDIPLQLGLGAIDLSAIAIKDFALGFFIALAIRRERISLIVDALLPVGPDPSDDRPDGGDSGPDQAK